MLNLSFTLNFTLNVTLKFLLLFTNLYLLIVSVNCALTLCEYLIEFDRDFNRI